MDEAVALRWFVRWAIHRKADGGGKIGIMEITDGRPPSLRELARGLLWGNSEAPRCYESEKEKITSLSPALKRGAGEGEGRRIVVGFLFSA